MHDDTPTRLGRLLQQNLPYRRLFATRDGQRVLKDLLTRFGCLRQSAMAAGDPQLTAYLLGRQDAVLYILRAGRIDVQEAARLAWTQEIPHPEQEHLP